MINMMKYFFFSEYFLLTVYRVQSGETDSIIFFHYGCFQGNLYAGERLVYRLWGCQPTIELAVSTLGNIFLLLENNQAYSWLTTAHAVLFPFLYIDISLVESQI